MMLLSIYSLFYFWFLITFSLAILSFSDTIVFLFAQKLLQIPTISESIEVWDFLSVDSQVGIKPNMIVIFVVSNIFLAEQIF